MSDIIQFPIHFLTRHCKGWERAWKIIEHNYGDRSCYNKVSGEVWQYLGTYNSQHQFRHRDLPYWNSNGFPNKRVYENIPVEPDDFDVIEASPTEEKKPIPEMIYDLQPPIDKPIDKPFDFDRYNGIRR